MDPSLSLRGLSQAREVICVLFFCVERERERERESTTQRICCGCLCRSSSNLPKEILFDEELKRRIEVRKNGGCYVLIEERKKKGGSRVRRRKGK